MYGIAHHRQNQTISALNPTSVFGQALGHKAPSNFWVKLENSVINTG